MFFSAVDLLQSGDSFSGTAAMTNCVKPGSYPLSLVVTKSSGNVFKGAILSEIEGNITSKGVSGFFSVHQRKLVMTPEGYSSKTMSMVCVYDPKSDNDADCKILTDNFSRVCGTVGLSRDYRGIHAILVMRLRLV